MQMKCYNTKFKNLIIVKSKRFVDSRGEFRELFKKNKQKEKKEFRFTCYSLSKKNVLRGLHLQNPYSQGKFVSVVKGKILDVVVDLRKNSKTFKEHFKIILSSNNCKSLYVPEGFAHGFVALDNINIVVYHLTGYRKKNNEIGISWNDKNLNINWKIKNPILSKKDKFNNISFDDYEKKYIL